MWNACRIRPISVTDVPEVRTEDCVSPAQNYLQTNSGKVWDTLHSPQSLTADVHCQASHGDTSNISESRGKFFFSKRKK